MLSLLLEITINSISTDRPLFSTPLQEPAFYRKKFLKWVREGLEEYQRDQTIKKKIDDELEVG